MKKVKKAKKDEFLEIYKKVRKPMPPPSKVIHPKKKYDRRNKKWMNEDEVDE